MEVSVRIPRPGDGRPGPAVTASVTLPRRPISEPAGVLICWPGYSYDRRYWDAVSPGAHASFAEHLSACGFVVVAADPLGVGTDDAPDPGLAYDLEGLAYACDQFAREIRRRVADGALAPDLPALDDATVLSVGWSMGGILSLAAQALHETYDGICVLGVLQHDMLAPVAAMLPETPTDAELQAVALEAVRAMFGVEPDPEAFLTLAHAAPLQEMLHGPAATPDLLAFDAAAAASWPLAPLIDINRLGVVDGYARRVTSPVFFGVGEREMGSPDSAHRHAASYPSCSALTVFVQPEAYHSHNFQPNRRVLWDRIGAWAAEQVAVGRAV